MIGKEEHNATTQSILDNISKQQIYNEVVRRLTTQSAKVTADPCSPKGGYTSCGILDQSKEIKPVDPPLFGLHTGVWIANPISPIIGFSPNLPESTDDGEIHINIKKHNIKFNFKN